MVLCETIVDKSGDVVILLISPLLGYGYHMYTDNYFTYIPLAMYLYNLTGTTRSNRVGLQIYMVYICFFLMKCG